LWPAHLAEAIRTGRRASGRELAWFILGGQKQCICRKKNPVFRNSDELLGMIFSST
jgi:hypothetical protein